MGDVPVIRGVKRASGVRGLVEIVVVKMFRQFVMHQ